MNSKEWAMAREKKNQKGHNVESYIFRFCFWRMHLNIGSISDEIVPFSARLSDKFHSKYIISFRFDLLVHRMHNQFTHVHRIMSI